MHRWKLSALLAAAVTVAGSAMAVPAGAPAAAAPGVSGPSDRPPASDAARSDTDPTAVVTLVTGDRVELLPKEKGRRQQVLVRPAVRPGGPVGFSTTYQEDGVHVVPDDVARLVPDVLDPDLFNVTALTRMRYDDHRAPSLPLIVEHRAGTSLRATSALRAGPTLASIDATAADLPKKDAAHLGGRLAAAQRAAYAPGRSAQPRAAVDRLGGIERIWLDRPVEASELDANLTQVGAPKAWESGANGEGVTVAVLDTGVDAGHPDLRGQVVDHQNFTADADGDAYGHGTHVASLVAGTGAAANGARKGVAYAADLLDGKVLGDDGRGQESWVVAGMEWAAEQDADVVSMSLGARARPGGGPLEQAADQLTAETGTLFVAAAGNDGNGLSTLHAPAAADSALAVGAMWGADTVAFISSRGPRPGDSAFKPDLVAPGVDITGARTGGRAGDPADSLYATYSGTSQATPHVAGAAAMLLQQHPDWTPSQVKAALVGAANPIAGLSGYDQGGGRLDIPRALEARLLAGRAHVDFGLLRYPQTTPVTRPLELTNLSATPITVDLAADVQRRADNDGPTPMSTPAAARLLTLASDRVTVPAGGSTVVEVTVTPGADVVAGYYTGAIAATEVGGTATAGPLLRVPVGFHIETENYDLHVKVVDRAGNPYAGGDIEIVRVKNGTGLPSIPLDANGETTLRMEPGVYSVMSRIVTPPRLDVPASFSLAGDPEVRLDADTTLVIDARRAKRLSASVQGVPTDPIEVELHYSRRSGDVDWGNTRSAVLDPEAVANGQVYVQPTSPVSVGAFGLTTRWQLEPRTRPASGQPEFYDLVFEDPAIPTSPRYVVTSAEAKKLAWVTSTYHDPGTEASTYLFRTFGTDLVPTIAFGVPLPLRVPQQRVEAISPGPGDLRWWTCAYVGEGTVSDGTISFPASVCDKKPLQQTPRQRQTVDWMRGLHPRPLSTQHFSHSLYLETGLGDGQHNGELEWGAIEQSRIRLWRDGALVADDPDDFFVWAAPDGGAFTLQQDLAFRPDILPHPLRSTTRWTFTSTPPPVNETRIPDLLVTDYVPTSGGKGKPSVVDLTFRHNKATLSVDVRNVEVRVSSDGGKHWRAVRTDEWASGKVRTWVPANIRLDSATTVLRASATDLHGHAFEQTMVSPFPDPAGSAPR